MGEQCSRSESQGHASWNERDEIQRLDHVAGVVAPTSLAGCVACAALIATGHLVHGASYVLGAAAFVLLGCAVTATVSLNWSPWEAVQDGKSLGEVIARKRSRTKVALAGLVLTVFLSFGTALVMELATDSGSDHVHQERNTHSKGSGLTPSGPRGALASGRRPGVVA